MRLIRNFLIFCLAIFAANIAAASTTTGLFWYAATASDTALAERIAPSIAVKLSERIALLSPDFLRDRYGDTLTQNSSYARTRFQELFPDGVRLEFHLQRLGNSSSLKCYRIEQTKRDSLRLFYAGGSEEIADWFEFYFLKWFLGDVSSGKQTGTATIIVDGTPIGAQISIDGIPTGERIPARLVNISEGEHLIEITGNLRASQKVLARADGSVGITLRGKPITTLLEVVSDPPGLPIEIDGVSSGYTPYLRESTEASLSVTIGGGERELISRIVDLEPGQWRTMYFAPQLMNRIAIRTFPPGAVIYDGPVRIGSDGDTIPCSPHGQQQWTVDHPYAFPKTFPITGTPGKVQTMLFQLPPALAFLRLHGWYHQSTLRVDKDVIAVSLPDSQEVLAGKRTLEIATPGFRTRRTTLSLERGAHVLVDATPIP
ncbi:MAG: hypothetical protein OEM52_14780, partial [bacterium]|nr:hypothetical protein [bacterium]